MCSDLIDGLVVVGVVVVVGDDDVDDDMSQEASSQLGLGSWEDGWPRMLHDNE